MSWYQRIAFYSLLATLPIQLGKHFWPLFSFVQGIRIDYLSPTLYVSDICFIFLVLVSFHELKDKFAKLFFSKLGILITFCFLVSTLFASNWQVSIFGIVKFLEFFYTALFISTFFKRKDIEVSLFILSLGALVESVIIFFQFLSQHSLGGAFYFLGERTFNVSTPGIATFQFMGEDLLRPYGTFPHPNVAAFFLLSVFIWLFFSYKSLRNITSYAKAFALFIIGLAILFTFSRIVILLLIIIIIFTIYKKSGTFLPKTKVLLFSSIGFVLFILGILYFQRFELSFAKDLYLRGELINISLKIFLQHMLFGTGLNNFFYSEIYYQKSLSPILLQPVHNIYLLWLAQTGILGFIVAVYFVSKLILNLRRLIKTQNADYFYKFVTIIVLCIGVSGLFDHYFLTLQQGQLMVAITLGFCFSKINS